MCFQAIINVAIDVKNKKQCEQCMQNQCKLKEQAVAAAKSRKPEHKPEYKPSTDKKQ